VLGILGALPLALWALRRAPDRGFAIAAMALSAVETILVLAVLAIAMLS
jgi:hypothetical protein